MKTIGEFDGKTVLITGGAQGIGRATAELFAAEKARVAIFDWNAAEGQKAIADFHRTPAETCFLQVDVGQEAQVRDAVAQLKERWGRIDVLFSNAAVQVNKLAADLTEEDWDRMHSVNLKGAFLCCRHVIPIMRLQHDGAIILCGSGQSLVTSRTFSSYAATKAGLLAFMKGVALDYAADGIRANCVLPGCTDSALFEEPFRHLPAAEADAQRRSLIESIPMRRLARPEEIARAVRFLASRDASYITGTFLQVDGGLSA